jgi:hypothetical protein
VVPDDVAETVLATVVAVAPGHDVEALTTPPAAAPSMAAATRRSGRTRRAESLGCQRPRKTLGQGPATSHPLPICASAKRTPVEVVVALNMSARQESA